MVGRSPQIPGVSFMQHKTYHGGKRIIVAGWSYQWQGVYIYIEPTWPLLWLEFRPCFGEKDWSSNIQGQKKGQKKMRHFIVASLPNLEGSWFIMDLMLVTIDAVILGLEVFQDADLGTMGWVRGEDFLLGFLGCFWYGWWFRNPAVGSLSTIIYRLYTSQVVGNGISSNSMSHPRSHSALQCNHLTDWLLQPQKFFRMKWATTCQNHSTRWGGTCVSFPPSPRHIGAW